MDSRLRLAGGRAKATLFVQRSIRRVLVDVRERIWCDGASRGQHHRRRWRHPGWQSGCAGKARFGSGGRGPRAETLESAPHAASERGISAKTCACDVARARLPATCTRGSGAFREIDLLFANTGIAEQSRVATADAGRWRSVFEVNLLAAVRRPLSRAAHI